MLRHNNIIHQHVLHKFVEFIPGMDQNMEEQVKNVYVTSTLIYQISGCEKKK